MSGLTYRLLAILVVLLLAYNATGLTASPVTDATSTTTVTYAPDIAPDTACVYTVRAGDWLSRIAAEYRTTWPALARLNGLRNPNLLFIGQRLDVCPNGGSSPPPNGGTSGATNGREFCHSAAYWLPRITQWATPPGCYAGIYIPNLAAYPIRPNVGWCSWWAEEMHPWLIGSQALHLPAHRQPVIGAVVRFLPGEQGAGPLGHYANVIAIRGDGWLLISEENDVWRGGGFGRVDYRYVRVTPGTLFLY